MATASSATASERRPSLHTSSFRSGVRHAQTGTPHTPQRHHQGLSTFASSSSPGSSLRHDEDVIVVEMGSRWLRAGFEGDSTPICDVGFGREEGRRVGDYRGWIKNDGNSSTSQNCTGNIEQWSNGYELWSMDIRGLDIGLVEDKVERAFREIYNKYLLTDAGSSRLALVLPSVVPHPLLSALLSTLFHRWRYPSITLLPSSAMAAVAAGVRSALVVDIGWEETVVTGVYEYREVKTRRSTRAMKFLMQQMGTFLSELIQERDDPHSAKTDGTVSITFEQCEEIMNRMSWCRQGRKGGKPSESEDNDDGNHEDAYSTRKVSVPLPAGQGSTDADIPFSKFGDVVEDALFAGGTDSRDWDDEDMPLDILVYNTLLALSPDVRGICMARIIFVGGGSNIPGIRQRILADTDSLVNTLKWNTARGKIIDKRAREQQRRNVNNQQRNESNSSRESDDDQDISREPESNFIDEKLQRDERDSNPSVRGILREVESIGAWAGASLVASLKGKGLVEVEREKFLQNGLAGASRDADIHPMLDRRSGYGAAMARSGGERSSWTLGEWG